MAAGRKPKKFEKDGNAEGEFVADETAEDREKDRPSLFPSSMGLSFAVDGSVDTLTATLTWGQYIVEAAELPLDGNADPASDEPSDGRSTVWQRHPQSWTFDLPLAEGLLTP